MNYANNLRDFSNLLTTELQLWNLRIRGTLECRRNRLQNVLKVELQLELIIHAIDRGDEGKDAALLLIMQAIPCIMHLENRVGGNYSFAFPQFRVISKVENKKLRSFCVKHHAHCEYKGAWNSNPPNDTVLKVSLSNNKTRRFVSEIEIGVLIDYVFHHPEDHHPKDAEKEQIWHSLLWTIMQQWIFF